MREEMRMWEEKLGRPEWPEVTGVIGDLEAVARRLAGAPKGGTAPTVVMEDGDSSPRMGKRHKINRKTGRRTEVNAVYVGREWVRARMEEELAYRWAFYLWLHYEEPKGEPG